MATRRPTRRQALLAGAAAAAAGAVGLDAWAAPTLPGHARREVKLKVSDGLTSQEWITAGRTRLEAAERLTLFDGETIDITIVNDSSQDRFVTWGAEILCQLVRKDTQTTLTFHVEKSGNYTIALLSDKGVTAELRADVVSTSSAKPRVRP